MLSVSRDPPVIPGAGLTIATLSHVARPVPSGSCEPRSLVTGPPIPHGGHEDDLLYRNAPADQRGHEAAERVSERRR